MGSRYNISALKLGISSKELARRKREGIIRPAQKKATGIFQRHARSVMGRRYNYQPPKPKEEQTNTTGTGTKGTGTKSMQFIQQLLRKKY